MTGDGSRRSLAAEAAAIEASIGQLGTPGSAAGRTQRVELEQRVARLCLAAQSLPAAEAHAFAETLSRLVAALDAAAVRLRATGASDSVTAPTDHRRAAAAYGSATGRRRGGF